MKGFRARNRQTALVVAAVWIGLAGAGARAQSPRPMSLMDLANLQRPLDPELPRTVASFSTR